jgi:excisionase family DNA binding protein
MNTDLLDALEPVTPSPADIETAKESIHPLARAIQENQPLRLRPENGGVGQAQTFELPAAAAQLLLRLMADMAAGNAIAVIPIHAELTTQQAADMLGVSRPFIIKQIEEGKLPHRKVGTHRRIVFKDLMDYRHRMDADRKKALDELASLGQEMEKEMDK